MIKSQAQRQRTEAQIEGFRRAAESSGATGKRAEVLRKSYEGMISQLEDELREYDDLRAGSFRPPPIARLDEIAPFLVKLRIASGCTQTQLAERLGVSKQVVSRLEEQEYQTASVARIQEILDVLGVTTEVRLTA
ncbi:MAG: helix-turn-helix domain-containing protein [Bryobacterales bacterium]